MFRRTLFNLRIRDFFRKQFEDGMDDELRFHLNLMIENNIRMGMTRDEARREAVIAFGGMDQVKEECRETRTTYLWTIISLDLRHAVRMLARNRLISFTTVILITAITGLLCASFAFLDAIVLRTLPVPKAEQLVALNPTAILSSSIYDALVKERRHISQICGKN